MTVIIKEKSSTNLVEYELKLKTPLVLGHHYELSDEKYVSVNISLLPLINEEFYDEAYTYDGDDLGMKYYKDHTEFRLWSPLASSAKVIYTLKNKTHVVKMNRLDKGVYYASIPGDLELATYLYEVIVDGEIRVACDPYAVASTQNSTHSVVVNLEKTRKIRPDLLD